MFENLTDSLQRTFKRLRGHGKLTEKHLREGMREVRLALLEADVNYKVVKEFIEKVHEKALGREVLNSITPGQQVVKVVHDELVRLMGGDPTGAVSEEYGIKPASSPPTVVLLVGLQGSGKTTAAGKLAKHFHSKGHKPLLVAADVYRPAAVRQLQILAESLSVPCFGPSGLKDPVDICKASVKHAASISADVILIDTAGRLHIDQELMEELRRMKAEVHPHETLMVADAMTGQDAVAVAQSFQEQLGLDSVMLTKLDGDARGGAALSIRAVVGKPIKFAGVGEKLDALEPFHPDRMASRILGMGDIVTLVEKAQQVVDEESVAEWEKKLLKAQFTFDDFLDQLRQLKKMGPLDQLMEMVPGMGKLRLPTPRDEDLVKVEAIISSMTRKERANPQIIGGSRRRRIARGSGTKVQDVNRLLKQFDQLRKLMKKMGKGKLPAMTRGLPF